MSYLTTRKEWEALKNDVVDDITGMTRADYIEYQYGDDIYFLDDKKPEEALCDDQYQEVCSDILAAEWK